MEGEILPEIMRIYLSIDLIFHFEPKPSQGKVNGLLWFSHTLLAPVRIGLFFIFPPGALKHLYLEDEVSNCSVSVVFACLYFPLYVNDFFLFYRGGGSVWLGEEGGLALIGQAEGILGTSCPVYMLSHAGGIDGKTAGALAVAFRLAEGYAQSKSKRGDSGLK